MVYRISDGSKYLILGIVGTIDAVEFVLTILQVDVAIETIANVVEYGFLLGFFAMHGINYFETKKSLKTKTSGGLVADYAPSGLIQKILIILAESTPYLGGLLPLLTYTVWKTIEDSRREDEARQNKNGNKNVIRQKVATNTRGEGNVIRQKRS